jgi:hypothetical protein
MFVIMRIAQGSLNTDLLLNCSYSLVVAEKKGIGSVRDGGIHI